MAPPLISRACGRWTLRGSIHVRKTGGRKLTGLPCGLGCSMEICSCLPCRVLPRRIPWWFMPIPGCW